MNLVGVDVRSPHGAVMLNQGFTAIVTDIYQQGLIYLFFSSFFLLKGFLVEPYTFFYLLRCPDSLYLVDRIFAVSGSSRRNQGEIQQLR